MWMENELNNVRRCFALGSAELGNSTAHQAYMVILLLIYLHLRQIWVKCINGAYRQTRTNSALKLSHEWKGNECGSHLWQRISRRQTKTKLRRKTRSSQRNKIQCLPFIWRMAEEHAVWCTARTVAHSRTTSIQTCSNFTNAWNNFDANATARSTTEYKIQQDIDCDKWGHGAPSIQLNGWCWCSRSIVVLLMLMIK